MGRNVEVYLVGRPDLAVLLTEGVMVIRQAQLQAIAMQIENAASPAQMTTRIVGIDGCGGAGRSSLARELSNLLAGAPIIQTDDFASWDNPLGWSRRFLEQVLEPLETNRLIISGTTGQNESLATGPRSARPAS